MPNPEPISADTRLGFYYFPDSLHYREKDLQTWLPILKSLGAGWLVLQAPADRAIPEGFLSGLLASGIKPVLHFDLPTYPPTDRAVLRLLLSSYARWGVRWVIFFDMPNRRESWPAAAWAQPELVERFIDQFLPLAEAALQEGLQPMFPPLEPGGDYWDLAFLRLALRSLKRRGSGRLLEKIGLSAYAWAGNRPLDWGAGGAEQWPQARPYWTPSDSQDHQGFRIFEWYLAVAEQELGRRPALLLAGAGVDRIAPTGEGYTTKVQEERQQQLVGIAQLALAGELPDEILACNLWLLSSEPDQVFASSAWVSPEGEFTLQADWLRKEVANRQRLDPDAAILSTDAGKQKVNIAQNDRPIAHYVLLPLYAWGAADWDLRAIEPLLHTAHPTIGFSLLEARLAERVTVVGGEGVYPDEAIKVLEAAGCQVQRLATDGTLFATEEATSG